MLSARSVEPVTNAIFSFTSGLISLAREWLEEFATSQKQAAPQQLTSH